MKYEAHFTGGSAHGEIIPLKQVLSRYSIEHTYNENLTTVSNYKLKKQEDNKLFYNLSEEVFKSVQN